MPSAKHKSKGSKAASKPVTVEAEKGENRTETMARVLVSPYFRHGTVANGVVDKMIGNVPGEPRFDDYAKVIKAKAERVSHGDLRLASEMLTAQALSLDAIFTEMARRSAMNMGDYLNASERYMRLALKAQAGSRATLEALVKIHQPREQTVKHVHVNEGGQAIVADQFHHQQGDGNFAQTVKQSLATGAAGELPALPCADSHGVGVPIASRKREAAVQDARRD